MINGKTVIAIIPARSGSKGLPGKNIKQLCGKPLIAWSIEVALESKYIDEVMVSTDCMNIAGIANQFGSSVPFIRPEDLAGDTASSIDVIKHAIDFYRKKLSRSFDYIVLLEPTSPLRTSDDIDGAITKLVENSIARSVVGICKTESQNPAFLVKKGRDGLLVGYENLEMKVVRRQDISDVYFFEGSVYISDIPTLIERGSFYHDWTLGYVVPKWKSFEIDDLDDFIIVEALMSHKGRVK